MNDNTTGQDGQTAAEERLSLRVDRTNENHHLWNNNGTWWLHYTVHLPDFTKKRVRTSLRTQNVHEARRKRDQFLCKILASTGAAGELLAA